MITIGVPPWRNGNLQRLDESEPDEPSAKCWNFEIMQVAFRIFLLPVGHRRGVWCWSGLNGLSLSWDYALLSKKLKRNNQHVPWANQSHRSNGRFSVDKKDQESIKFMGPAFVLVEIFCSFELPPSYPYPSVQFSKWLAVGQTSCLLFLGGSYIDS